MTQGTFIVIEGTDGSGKETQSRLLVDRLKNEGYAVEIYDFPQYGKSSSYFVREYLNGKYGSIESVGPYTASLFYALDRYEAAPQIKAALDAGTIVIANRYTGSNMAHQGTKFINPEERKGYYLWLDAIEFQMLKIPRPDMSLVLRVPAETAQKLVDKKEKRAYTNKKRDIHEASLEHLQKAVEVYDNLCELFPKDFKQLDCVRDNKLLEVEAIHNLIWETVNPMLPSKKNKSSTKKDNEKKRESDYLIDGKHGLEITAAGNKKLEEFVTSTTNNVYGFNESVSPQIIAAAMARLCRRRDDMRITLLDEFIDATDDTELLQRVVTAFGDNSVKQLLGQHVIVEGASNLLTKKLEWGRLAAYAEQSTRYIYFDEKDKDGSYKYFVPAQLDTKTKQSYIETMDTIFDTYSKMVHKLTDYVQTHSSVPKKEQDEAWQNATRAQACDAARPVLPVATKATVGIFGSAQALESLITHLQGDALPEAQDTGSKLLTELRKVSPAFYEGVSNSANGNALLAYRANTAQSVKKLAASTLSENYSSESEAVTLSAVWPRNELDIVADMLYEHSGLSLHKITSEVATWSYDKKLEVFESYVGERLNRHHRPGRALEKVHYSWDLMCDYGVFRDLQRHRMVDDLEWQTLTPRYGYETPKLVEDAKLTDEFEVCFDLSLKLYSILQGAGYENEAQYATLLGHKMRWKVTINAREAFLLLELRSSPQGHPNYRKLTQLMHQKIAEVHPLLANAMKFINKDEDPELTRLAAEKATQSKLQQLGQ